MARAKTDSLCWQICKWKALYVAPVEPGSDAEKYAMMYPMQFVRLWCGRTTVEGNYVDMQLAAIRAAGGLELLGIALQLLRIAACRDRFGGRLVDHLGHVASLCEIALESGVSTRRMQAALKTLSGPRIAFVQQSPSVEVGTPIGLRAASRDAHTPKGGDGRPRPSGGSDDVSPGRPESAGDRESRQAGGSAPGTGSTAAAAQNGAPAGGLPASCGPPRDDAHGAGYADGHADDKPQGQEQEQEKAEEQSARNRSAAPKENKIGKVGQEQDPQAQARAREGESTGKSDSMGMGTGTGQPTAEEPTEPTGADPKAATASQGGAEPEIAIECVDNPPTNRNVRHPASASTDPLTLAVYAKLYPTAQFESTESLKARDGRGLSMRQFRATEQGAISSGIAAAIAGKTEAAKSALWAWCISVAEDVYRRDHRKRRTKPLACIWLWRLKRHGFGSSTGGGAACGSKRGPALERKRFLKIQ